MTYLHLDLLLTDKEAIITNTHFDKEILRERLIKRKNFWVQKLQTLLIHEVQINSRNNNFVMCLCFSGLNLGKLPNYVRYFGSNNVEGIAESRIDAEISWVEVDGAGWRFK